ncbi:PTS ascorbate transporter subunit IIC [Enterococcus sp. LJL90]
MNEGIVNAVRTLTQAPIFLGIVTFLGLLLQKKKIHEIIDGVIKTIVGMVMLTAGSNLLTSTLTPLITKLNDVSSVKGVVPQNFAVFGAVMGEYSVSVVSAFILAFLLNLIIVKIIPWKIFKNVYLTVHVSLILSSFLIISISSAFKWEPTSLYTIITSGLILGLYNTFSPAIPRLYSKDMTQDAFTLGHNQQIGTFFAVKLAKLVGKPEDDAENIQLPKALSILKDTTISLAILMPAIFIGIGLYLGEENILELSGTTYWLVWLFLQGITFTVGFSVLLSGVRMFIAQLLPAFQGIANKFVPNAIPALDCAVFYSFSPTGSMLGFLSMLAGSIVAMVISIFFLPYVIFPSPNIVLFDGLLMGVFANRNGGWKGTIFSCFILGIFTHIMIIFLYPITGEFFGSGMTYSQTDYSFFWGPLLELFNKLF